MTNKGSKGAALAIAVLMLSANVLPLFTTLTAFTAYADSTAAKENLIICAECGKAYHASTSRQDNGNIWCSDCKQEMNERGIFVAADSGAADSKRYEQEVTSSPIKSEVKESAADLYTSAALNTANTYPRVTEVYSLNNKEAECYYRPTSEQVTQLGARVSKLGDFAAVYTGYYDINHAAVSKPPSGATRALEILGYDYILQDEYYDTGSKSYVAVKLGADISRTTAVMDLYKALGVELQDIYMYHTAADFTQNNSPAANMIGYQADRINGFHTFVFVTRTNPKLYLRKFAQDFNITDIDDDTSAITYAEFMVLTAKMMQMYGEPVMSEQEQLLLIQAYGAEAPVGVPTELLEAWMYLKARGVLNHPVLNYNAPISKTDFFDILMCVKDESSRTNFKEIQLTYELNTELVGQGYYANDMSVVLSDRAIIESEAVYSECTVYDYYIPISRYSNFVAVSGAELSDMYVSASREVSRNDKTAIPGSRYVGKDSGYYHYQIPIREFSDALTADGYYVIDTADESDYPACIYVEAGGGIYAANPAAGSDGGMKFNRRRFLSQEFTDGVDYERYHGIPYETEIGEETGGQEGAGAAGGDSGSKEVSSADIPTLTLDDWEGASLEVVPAAYQNSPGWVQIEESGRWRYLYKESAMVSHCQGGFYKIVSKAKDIGMAEGIYYFDNDGFAVSGWLLEGSFWYYLNPADYQMLYATTVTLNDVTYTFDQYGRMLDEDVTDYEWSGLTSVAGQWQFDQEAGKWWYLVDDGSVLYDDVYMIAGKLYYFDADGYMGTGFQDVYDNGDIYYFSSDGSMYQNKLTPDGYYTDHNGKVQASYESILSNNPLWSGWLARLQDGFCLTAHAAANSYYADNSWMNRIYGNNGKLYRITIYYSLYNETKDEIDALIQTLDASNVVSNQTATSFTTPISAQYISSLLSYANHTGDLTLVAGNNGLANFSESQSLLVSFTSLVEAGLFSPTVGTDGNSTIILQGIQETAGSRESPYSSSRTGFGQIYLNNKDKTIKVGSTIYRLSNDLTLWTTMGADELEETPQYLDSATGTLKDITGNQLYIDVRAVFGWAGNEFTFAVTKDEHATGEGKKVVLSPSGTKAAGYNPVYRDVKASFNGNITGTNGEYRVRVLQDYGSGNEDMIIMTNMYAIANFAIIRSYKSANNQESVYIVTYWPDELLEEYGVSLPAGSLQTLANSIGFAPHITGYTPRVTSLGGISSVSPGADIEPGNFYYDANYGLLYAAPMSAAFNPDPGTAGNGFEKLVKGELLCPLTMTERSVVYDMAMPYLPGTPYGSHILPHSGNARLDDLYPMIGGLSYFLWREQTSAGVPLDSVVAKDNQNGDYFYFGQLRLIKESNTKVKVKGLKTSGGGAISLSVSADSPINFINVDVFTSAKGNAQAAEHKVYVTAPGAITYVAADGEVTRDTAVSWSVGGESNIFSNWADYKLNDYISAIESTKNLLLMIAMYIIPMVGFLLSMIIFGFSLMSDFKVVQNLCNKYLDPVKLLTLGAKDINTCGGIKYYACVLTLVVSFALAHGGNILKILRWFIYWFAETMNILF